MGRLLAWTLLFTVLALVLVGCSRDVERVWVCPPLRASLSDDDPALVQELRSVDPRSVWPSAVRNLYEVHLFCASLEQE